MACLSMILYRRTERLYDQEKLAMYFGVRISAECQDAFSKEMPLLTSHNYDDGDDNDGGGDGNDGDDDGGAGNVDVDAAAAAANDDDDK